MTLEKKQTETENAERKPLVYQDFNLRFGGYNEADSTFKVWVEGDTPGGGSMRPDDASERTYNPNAFWSDPAQGTGGLLGRLDRRKLAREEMFTLGHLLADLALPEGRVRELFRQSVDTLKAGEGLRLRLHIDPIVLAQLPWEMLTLPQASGEPQASDFLALRREISIARTDTVEGRARSAPNRALIRVVGAFSSPEDQDDLGVDKDLAGLEQAVRALNGAAGRQSIEATWAARPLTREALEQALADDADIFHFAGHGQFERLSMQGQIILERKKDGGDIISDYYSGEQLATLLGNAGVRLVVLGACDTGRRASEFVWSGVAPALTHEKIPAVVANQFKILDTSAILLVARIFPRVLAGYTIDEALYEARQGIYQQYGLEQRDWVVPVLYLHDKSGVLFPRPESDPTGASSTSPFVQVSTTFNRVLGEVIDTQIGLMTGGRLQISNKVDVVEKGANFTSLKLDKLGG